MDAVTKSNRRYSAGKGPNAPPKHRAPKGIVSATISVQHSIKMNYNNPIVLTRAPQICLGNGWATSFREPRNLSRIPHVGGLLNHHLRRHGQPPRELILRSTAPWAMGANAGRTGHPRPRAVGGANRPSPSHNTQEIHPASMPRGSVQGLGWPMSSENLRDAVLMSAMPIEAAMAPSWPAPTRGGTLEESRAQIGLGGGRVKWPAQHGPRHRPAPRRNGARAPSFGATQSNTGPPYGAVARSQPPSMVHPPTL